MRKMTFNLTDEQLVEIENEGEYYLNNIELKKYDEYFDNCCIA